MRSNVPAAGGLEACGYRFRLASPDVKLERLGSGVTAHRLDARDAVAAER